MGACASNPATKPDIEEADDHRASPPNEHTQSHSEPETCTSDKHTSDPVKPIQLAPGPTPVTSPNNNSASSPQPTKRERPAGLQASRSVKEGLSKAYTVKSLLGSGAEGNTWLCIDQQATDVSNNLIAVKMIKLPLPSKLVQAIMREIKIQAELGDGHLNIIKPKEVVLTSHYLGLVMEYAAGGSLTQLVTKRYKACRGQGQIIGEDESRYLFRQIVNAVDFCHRNKVVHRDLKLDNTLLSADNPPRVKLCDFGFARGWGDGGSHFSTVIGTPDYMSPQLTVAKMVKGQVVYDGIKADVWAMGVLLCVMLVGKFPFEGTSIEIDNCKDPMKKIWMQQTSSVCWRDNANLTEVLKLLSPSVIDLLDKMFELDEKKRCDLATIQQHPWFVERCSPHFEEALAACVREQGDIDAKAASGAFKSKQRDQAIADLISTAASDDFRRQAASPINSESSFTLFARIGLTTVRPWYPKVDRRSVRLMMNELERHKSVLSLGKKVMEAEGVVFGPSGNALEAPGLRDPDGSVKNHRIGGSSAASSPTDGGINQHRNGHNGVTEHIMKAAADTGKAVELDEIKAVVSSPRPGYTS